MGALAKFQVASQSTSAFKNMMGGLGSTPSMIDTAPGAKSKGPSFPGMGPFGDAKGQANMVMDFVRDHPILSKAVSVVFPPARGVIMAAEIGGQVRDVLGSDRQQATQAYAKNGQNGEPLLQQMRQTAQELHRNRQRDRMAL